MGSPLPPRPGCVPSKSPVLRVFGSAPWPQGTVRRVYWISCTLRPPRHPGWAGGCCLPPTLTRLRGPRADTGSPPTAPEGGEGWGGGAATPSEGQPGRPHPSLSGFLTPSQYPLLGAMGGGDPDTPKDPAQTGLLEGDTASPEGFLIRTGGWDMGQVGWGVPEAAVTVTRAAQERRVPGVVPALRGQEGDGVTPRGAAGTPPPQVPPCGLWFPARC